MQVQHNNISLHNTAALKALAGCYCLQAGFGAAVQYCIDQDITRCWQRTQQLAAQLRQMLSQHVPGLVIQDKGRQLCGIVSFTLNSHPDAAAVREWLERRQPPINVSALQASCRTVSLQCMLVHLHNIDCANAVHMLALRFAGHCDCSAGMCICHCVNAMHGLLA
jgi:hypothetical protein